MGAFERLDQLISIRQGGISLPIQMIRAVCVHLSNRRISKRAQLSGLMLSTILCGFALPAHAQTDADAPLAAFDTDSSDADSATADDNSALPE